MSWRTPRARRGPLVAGFRAVALCSCASALSVALSGCGFDVRPTAESPQNACTLVDDCLSGVCMDGLCVEPTPDALRVFVEVEPQEDAALGVLPRWRYAPELVVGPDTQDLVLPQGVEVVGQVRMGSLLVPADLVFTRIQEIPAGDADVVRTRTYAEPTRVSVNGTQFEADFASVLGGGGVYDVSVTPTTAPFTPAGDASEPTTANRVVPPLLLRNVTLPTDTSRWELTVDVPSYESPCDANLRVGCTLTGMVIQANDLGVEVPENGLQVRAVERSTGRTVSSLGVTEEGQFAVAVSSDTGPYALLVSAGSDRPLFPEVLADVAYAADGALRIEVPAFPTVVYSGLVESADGLPLADAQVRFRAQALVDPDTGLEARLTRTVVTGTGDAAGTFEVALVPGDYDVVITPAGTPTADPLDDPGILAQSVSIGDVREVRGQLFVLPRRATFGAQIWAPAGEPLAVEVEASPLRLEGTEGPVARYNRAAEASAGPTGWFSLRLDLGRYDITARPPSDTGYPWVLFPSVGVAIPGSTDTRTVDIGMPVPRHGVVRTNDGAPVAGARVTAYVVLDDVDGPRAVAIARTLSDADGAYRLLLPSRLETAR